jgi:hypothetical protein
VSGGQPVAACGHPGDDETILKSHSEIPCAVPSRALEISLRHRETGTGPEGNFGSLEEEVDRPEGNFKADDGGLGHVKEQRLTGSFGTQGNLSSESEGPAGVHRNTGQPVFGQLKVNRESETRGNLGHAKAEDRSTRRGFWTNGGRSRRRGLRAIGRRARRDRARPLHLMHGGASSYVQDRRVRPSYFQCCFSGARRRRCASGCAASAPGTVSWQQARRRR